MTELPAEIDTSRPSIARVYDHFLGGKDNYAVDRAAAAAVTAVLPEAGRLATDNRDWLRRAVRFLVADAGITQILDLGSGLPTAGNVHEVAHAVDPSVRVAYVDIDPIVLAHGQALLARSGTTIVVQGDVRDVDAIVADPAIRAHLDLDRPFAILGAAILHHLSDAEDPYAVAAAMRAHLPSGGYLALGQFLDNGEPRAKELERALIEGGLGTGRFRTPEELGRFFEGLELVEPGVVYGNDWRPDADAPVDSPVRVLYGAGVGRKP